MNFMEQDFKADISFALHLLRLLCINLQELRGEREKRSNSSFIWSLRKALLKTGLPSCNVLLADIIYLPFMNSLASSSVPALSLAFSYFLVSKSLFPILSCIHVTWLELYLLLANFQPCLTQFYL